MTSCGTCIHFAPHVPTDPIDGRCEWAQPVPIWLLGVEWDRERVASEGLSCPAWQGRQKKEGKS